MQRLKRLERCEKGAPRAVMWFKRQDDMQIIYTFIDADSAGCWKNEEVDERRSDQKRIT